ncbi:hypothetical protein Tco_0670835 [Tanacetum coccineum]
MLKRYGMESNDDVDTPMVERSKLDEDPQRTLFDLTKYRSMVFRYLKGTINMCLWYQKDTDIELTTFADVDHASCQDSRKSTSRSAQFLYLRTKHIVVRYHFIKEQVENEMVELYFVKTAYQLANIFTKALRRKEFEFLINRLGLQSITPEKLKSLAESDEE